MSFRIDLNRAIAVVSLVVVTVAAVWFTTLLTGVGGASSRLPRWDEARHGLDAARLADAIRGLDLVAFFRDLWNMAYWPPTYPLLELPFMLIFGTDYSVPRTLMSINFGATILATYVAGVMLGGKKGVWAGLIAAAFVSSSPFLQLYGTVIMLELPGALLTLLSFVTYIRYRETGHARDLRIACGATLALFFCKYNFGILWMAAVFLLESWDPIAASPASASGGREPASDRFTHRVIGLGTRLASRIRTDFSARSFRTRAFLIFLVFYAGFLLAILLSGGWTWHLAGQRISVRKLGNPVSILALILLTRFLLKPRSNAALLRESFVSLSPRVRVYSTLVFAPIILWLLLPPHTSAFFNFVQNRPAERSLVENLLWYPRDFVNLYSPSPVVGTVVLVLGLVPILWIRRQSANERLLTLAVTVAFAATAMHRLKEARFLLVLTPLLWLSFGRVIAGLLEWISYKMGSGSDITHSRRVRTAWTSAAITLLLLAACLYQPVRFDSERTQNAFDRFTLEPALDPLLDAVCEAGASSNGVVLLGLWDWFSPNLVEWHARLLRPGLPESRIPRGPNRRARLGDPGRFLDQLAKDDVSTLLVLELHGDPPFAKGYREESGWLPPVITLLESDPRFRLASHLIFSEAGYSLREYRKE